MGKGSKRKKSYYMGPAKRQRKQEVAGSVGYLGSCNTREDIAVRECYDLLNAYADQVHGPVVPDSDEAAKEEKSDSAEKNSEDEDSEEDLDAALEKEITEAGMKKEKKNFRFQASNCGVSQNIFIRTTLPDPLPTLTAALEDIKATGKARTRALARLLPVQCVCPAYHKDIEKAFTGFCENRFSDKKSFYVIIKVKNTNTVNKTDVLGITLKVMKEVAPGCEPVLVNADTTVLINVLKTACYISEAPRYEHFKKYNLIQLCANEPSAPAGAAPKESKPVESAAAGGEGKAVTDGKEEQPVAETDEKNEDSVVSEDAPEAASEQLVTEEKVLESKVEGASEADVVNGAQGE